MLRRDMAQLGFRAQTSLHDTDRTVDNCSRHRLWFWVPDRGDKFKRTVSKVSSGMASRELSRTEALACPAYKHACHVMLYSTTNTLLFRRIPMRYIILMQMRFDGLLGFPGGLVDPSKETLEDGLSRELLEEMGVSLSISKEDHVSSCPAPPPVPVSFSSPPPRPSTLILHFYVKKIDEKQIEEIERAAASTAMDHGLEVLGMVRVPLYTLKRAGGLPFFLSNSFIGTARLQLVSSMLRLNMIAPEELHRALTYAGKLHQQTAEDLKTALTLTAP